MSKQPINYSTRDYSGVISQIDADADLKEQPTRWKRAIAGVFDVLNNTINAVVNAMTLRTAYDRTILQDVLGLIGYDLAWKETSSVLAEIAINPALTVSGPYTVAKADLIALTTGSTSKAPLRFEARDSLTFSIGTSTSSIRMYQQTTVPTFTVGQTNGQNWQTVELPDADILRETLSVLIGLDYYTRVANFGRSTATDKHYKIYYRSNGTAYLKFGGVDAKSGNQYGFKPSAGQNIIVTYATGGGLSSRINIGELTQYIGADSGVVSVGNTLASEGGTDPETIDNAREVAPLSIRAVTGQYSNESTGRAIALGIDGVLDVQLVKTGINAIDAYILPTAGGLPSGPLKASVETALEKASFLEEAVVTGRDPLYVDTNIIALAKLLPGYSSDIVLPYLKLALVLRISEVAVLTFRKYFSDGIASAIEQINADYYSFTMKNFTVGDDGAQIERLLNNIQYSRVGLGIAQEDLVIACGFVYGLDVIKITNPGTEIPDVSGYTLRPVSVEVTLTT